MALNGASFIARRDDPGGCPGDGWQLLVKQGKTGAVGEKGERGDRAPRISSWRLDRERYMAVPVLTDGSEGPTLELRALFEQFMKETSSDG